MKLSYVVCSSMQAMKGSITVWRYQRYNQKPHIKCGQTA